MQIATGTSLAVMVFTTIATTVSHQLKKSIHWRTVRYLAPGVLVGGFIGRQFAHEISSLSLGVIFIIGIYLIAFDILRQTIKEGELNNLWGFSHYWLMPVGVIISGFSSLLGLGGAILIIPLLLKRRHPMLQAVGTASVTSLIIAVVGTISTIYSAWDVSLSNLHFGYIYLPALWIIALGSICGAPIGVKLAHILPARRLKSFFAIFLMVVSTQMLLQLI